MAKDVQKIKDKNGVVLRVYDPGFMNTISAVKKNLIIYRLLEYAILMEIKEF